MVDTYVNLEAFQAAKASTSMASALGPAFPTFDQLNVGSNTRILVLVPHMDDEIMGCGGTMCMFAKHGAHLKVLYLTEYAHAKNSSYADAWVPMERSEADLALRTLRCFESELVRPGLKSVRCDRKSCEKVADVLVQYEPDILFVPCFDESRPDYIRTAAIAARVLQSYGREVDCYCYSFGGVSRPNTLVDITEAIEDKIEAMREHRSQEKLVDDEEKIREVNMYRLSTTQARDRYCEWFLRYPKERYLELAQDLDLLRESLRV